MVGRRPLPPELKAPRKSRAKPDHLLMQKRGAGGARAGAGRPAMEFTVEERRQVELLAGLGLPLRDISMLVRDGINHKTLADHFEMELQRGVARANARVSQTLFEKATKDTTAMIWWTKARMQWRERHELTGANGGPIKQEQLITLEPSEAYKRMLGVS
jgi:hypothetical protein